MAHPEAPPAVIYAIELGLDSTLVAAIAHVADCKTVAEVIAHEVKVVTGRPPDHETLDVISPSSFNEGNSKGKK